jgi:hypothetical protein
MASNLLGSENGQSGGECRPHDGFNGRLGFGDFDDGPIKAGEKGSQNQTPWKGPIDLGVDI